MSLLIRSVRAAFAVAGLAVFATSSLIAQHDNQAMTVIIVRHAEKAAAPADDPPLTAAGEERARDLLAAVRDAGISAVITTQYARTKATAQPTVAALSLPTEVVAAGSAATHPQDVASAVRKHAGHTVLVVGHSNTVPAIIEALGAKRPPAICDPEYDNLYIVTIAADGKAGVVRSKFGARTSVDAGCATMK
jgi:broad specificity phosphatase PhoE